jgi:methylmalonyl-CoA mutase N-terminal domain/subunit
MLRAIEQGYVQQEIQNAAYDYQRAVDAGEQIVVGVNQFTREEEPGVPIQRIDPELEARQVARLRAVRARRDKARWKASLEGLKSAATGGANLMPAILDAVESLATVGEIAGTLRGVFGEYREAVVV